MHTSSRRPFFIRQIISAKHHINKRKDGSKIMSVIFGVFTMVPVMVLRCGKYVLDESKVDSGVGMDKYGVNSYENNINVKYRR